MIGLVFGALTLTWVASGLLTMSPWGLLEGDRNPAQGVYSPPMSGAEVKAFVSAIGAKTPGLGDVRMLRSAPFGGRLFADAVYAAGTSVRLDVGGDKAALGKAQVRGQLTAAKIPVAEFVLLTGPDAYYYGHHRDVVLPVFRATLADAQHTRLYIDARNGAVVKTVGEQGRISRWTRTGLHDFDFAPIRRRPVWDIVVIALLLGVTAVCVTGFWMSLQRIRRDAARFASLRRTAPSPPSAAPGV
jgi:hypothetical protein